MPGPPPPPPPMGAPPSFVPPKGGPDDRSALLKSIHKGAKLKKTITNDKSAPIIPGKVTTSGSGVAVGAPVSNGLNLGGLFAGGMPKLRATGKLGPTTTDNNNEVNVRRRPEPPPQPVRNFSSVQNELKKQMASDNKNRGPPPPAPIENAPDESNGHKGTPVRSPTSQPVLNGFKYNSSSLHANWNVQNQANHRKAKSNVSLNSYEPPSTMTVNGFNQPSKPAINYGKPNLAPKPPQLNGQPTAPPKKLLMNGKHVNRAHSMRSPRSPSSPQNPDGAVKFGTVRNLSSVISQNLANSTGNLSSSRPRPPLINGRPTAPPPSIPPQQPPPPPPPHHMSYQPSKTVSVKAPSHAPPPPPPTTNPPPVPNHRMTTLPSRAPPAVPATNAPPPPPRHSSMATVRRRVGVDLEERYRHLFQQPDTFPKPPPYKHAMKIYSYKQVGSKQPAPQPPSMQQIPAKNWADSTSSAC